MLLEFKGIWLHDLFLKAIVHTWRDFQKYLGPRSKKSITASDPQIVLLGVHRGSQSLRN